MKKVNVIILFLGVQLFACLQGFGQKQFKALLFTVNNGWHHEAVNYGTVALRELAVRNNFDLVYFDDPKSFNDKFLEQFQVIIFLCNTGNVLDSNQKKVMERFIQSGKGYVGIHSASDTEYGWEWYTKLVGRMFYIHPVIQTAKLKVLDSNFPGLGGFANGKLWTDEFYEFQPEVSNNLHYVLGADETTYNPKVQWADKKSEGMGALHPLAWYHEYDGGRAFYTALGHLPMVYSDPAFLDHLYAGILYAATGKK